MANLIVRNVFTNEENCLIIENSFEIKDQLKAADYKFDGANKQWYKSVYDIENPQEELDFLIDKLGVNYAPGEYGDFPVHIAKQLLARDIEKFREMTKLEQYTPKKKTLTVSELKKTI